MKIGIASPISTDQLFDYLSIGNRKYPKGLGGFAVGHLVKGLLKRGHEVSVYSLDPEVEDIEKIEGKGLTIYYGPYRTDSRSKIKDIFAKERSAIKRAILEDNPDFINAHWSYEFALGALESGKYTIVTLRDSAIDVLLINRNLYRFIRLVMHYKVLKKANKLIANSFYTQKKANTFTTKHIEIIPNFIPDEYLFFKKKALNSQYPKIICVLNNGWCKLKNPKRAILAFNLLLKDYPNAQLSLIGKEFGWGEKAEKWANENNLNSNINYIGEVSNSEVIERIKESDILLHPSLEESFGMTLLEAMALGTPVIGGKDSGAVPWILNNGKAGILINVKKVVEIKNALSKLISNEAFNNQICQNGRKYVEEHFIESCVVKKYENAYLQVINELKRNDT